MIAIIDYDAGNLKSVEKALAHIGEESVITRDFQTILNADKVILPGVGAFGDAMANLKRLELDKVIRELNEKQTPFLGICLGLQLLFESSEESPGVEGLGLLKGQIRRIPDKEGLCGRSFEEAFFLANAENLEKYSEGLVLHELFENLTKDEIIDQAYNITRSDNFNGKKSGIAMDILLMEKYVIPRYIEEGLEWLAEN